MDEFDVIVSRASSGGSPTCLHGYSGDDGGLEVKVHLGQMDSFLEQYRSREGVRHTRHDRGELEERKGGGAARVRR